jgi:hypothetical protein
VIAVLLVVVGPAGTFIKHCYLLTLWSRVILEKLTSKLCS